MRGAVRWFAERMEEKLRRNDHKGGWGKCSNGYLLSRLREEIEELIIALQKDENVIDEATDVANFAMMIADKNRKGNV